MSVTNDVYTPDIDDAALFPLLVDMVIQKRRWSSIMTVLESYPREIAIEGLLCDLAWQIPRRSLLVEVYIEVFGWSLLPFARYRRDHPPQVDWDREFPNFGTRAVEAYRIACDALIAASEAELARD